MKSNSLSTSSCLHCGYVMAERHPSLAMPPGAVEKVCTEITPTTSPWAPLPCPSPWHQSTSSALAGLQKPPLLPGDPSMNYGDAKSFEAFPHRPLKPSFKNLGKNGSV